ncbi:cation:proton antiporter [Chloroflexota bacterium]
MQDIAAAVAFVGVLVFLAHLFTSIFSRTRIPDVILLIIIGVSVGPLLGLITPMEFGIVGPILTTITLIIILFESGTALKLYSIQAALRGAMTLAPLSFFSTMGVVGGLSLWLTDLEVLPAFILGAIVGSTSETVIIPLVKQLKIRRDTETLLSVESSINDVLSIIITVALVGAYELGEFNIASLFSDLIASFIVALVFGFIAAFIWSTLLNKIRAIKNAMFTTPAFVFIMFGIIETLGFSGAIFALAFGVTIGNIESIRFPFFKTDPSKEPAGFNETEKVFFSEVAFLLKTFFFVYLGISLELISGWFIILGLLFTIVAFILRIPAIRISLRKPMSARDASIVAIMVPKGLAAVVLASIPLQQGIIGGDVIQNVTYAVVLLSIVMTSVFILLFDKAKLSDIYARILISNSVKSGAGKSLPVGKLANKEGKITPAGTKLFGAEQKSGKKRPSSKEENS